MREKIENRLTVTCEDIDLTTLKNIEFYVRQGYFFGCYTPDAIFPSEMLVTIPFEDAKRLRSGEVKLQFAFTDVTGKPGASDVVTMTVGEFLKEVGYNAI